MEAAEPGLTPQSPPWLGANSRVAAALSATLVPPENQTPVPTGPSDAREDACVSLARQCVGIFGDDVFASRPRRVARARRGAEVPPSEVLPYSVAQLVGGFAAVLAMAAVFSSRAVDSLDTAPGLGISSGGALLLELIATALFVIVICTVATHDRAPWKVSWRRC
jgi:Major intrinsic protein